MLSLRYTQFTTHKITNQYKNTLHNLSLQLQMILENQTNQSITFSDITNIVFGFKSQSQCKEDISRFLQLFQNHLSNTPGQPSEILPCLRTLNKFKHLPEVLSMI